MHNHTYVCCRCQKSRRAKPSRSPTCCGEEMVELSERWRIPKRNDVAGWRALDEARRKCSPQADLTYNPTMPTTLPSPVVNINSPTYDGFKELAAEFIKSIPNIRKKDQIEAGQHCLTIAFLNMNAAPSEVEVARMVLDFAYNKSNKRILDILFAPLKK